jgi:hypothetical protein
MRFHNNVTNKRMEQKGRKERNGGGYFRNSGVRRGPKQRIPTKKIEKYPYLPQQL